MLYRKSFYFVLESLFLLFLFFQISRCDFDLTDWKTYSSQLNVITASIDSKGRIWAGSSGGVFVYDQAEKKIIKIFTNIDALTNIDVTCIKCSPENKIVLIGSSEGTIDIVTEDFIWLRTNNDIVKSRFSNPRINDIMIIGKRAYIAGGFGLGVMNFSNFNDTYFEGSDNGFGNFPRNTNINKLLLYNNEIWAGTSLGLTKADINASLINPNVWTNYLVPNIYEKEIFSLASKDNKIYISNVHYVYVLEADTFRVIDTVASYEKILNLNIINSKITLTTSFVIRTIENKENIYYFDMTEHKPLIGGDFLDTTGGRNSHIIFLNDLGLLIKKDTSFTYVSPNTPQASLFGDIAVDNRGILWAATYLKFQRNTGKGILRFDGNNWKLYNTVVTPEFGQLGISNNDFGFVSPYSKGGTIAGSWGTGMLYIDDSDSNHNKYMHFDSSNSPFSYPDNNYTIAGRSIEDAKGIVWTTNYSIPSQGPILIARTPDGKFYSYYNNYISTDRSYIELAIDFSNTKWLGSPSSGLLYYNDNGTPDNLNDDITGLINSGNTSALPNDNTINCLTVDKSGILWIGTPDGLFYFLNPSSVINNSNRIIHAALIPILKTQPVNAIMVDAINNKWIGTNNGIWVINPDGSEIITYINTDNSPLVNNEITSIATDINNGKIYIGTKAGMSEVTSLSVQPLQAFSIRCFPQPYNPSIDGELIIEGLAADAVLKVTALDGNLVKTINTSSRKAVWDGRDESGSYVSSGIYLVNASSSSSDAAAVGKIAIVRTK